MKIVHKEIIVSKGEIISSASLKTIYSEIEAAIENIHWPVDADGFYLNPNSKGKKQGEGNGVKPIKDGFVTFLKAKGWSIEQKRVKRQGVVDYGAIDAAKQTEFGVFGVEWETGNISSSHRSMNKICMGTQTGELSGGMLIVPSNDLKPYLTDRVGNYHELIPYLPFWKSVPYDKGEISILVIEHDGLRADAPRILKGTDGRALI